MMISVCSLILYAPYYMDYQTNSIQEQTKPTGFSVGLDDKNRTRAYSGLIFSLLLLLLLLLFQLVTVSQQWYVTERVSN